MVSPWAVAAWWSTKPVPWSRVVPPVRVDVVGAAAAVATVVVVAAAATVVVAAVATVAAVADVKVAAATAGVAVTVATMAAFAAPTAHHAKAVVAAAVSIDTPLFSL